MRVPKWVVALLLATVGISGKALAWDEKGHLQVADIAWTRLNDKAKKEIAVILMAGDPITRPASMSDTDVRAAFRKAAVFPDTIKFTKTTVYEDSIDAMNRMFFVTHPPDPKDNEDARCKTWHYYDIAIRDKGSHAPKESNALVALARARYDLAAIEGAASPDRKLQCWWLTWIAHLAGDLHQPLHCVSNHETHAEGDAGGNLFTVKNPGSERPGRLHGNWDGAITRAIAAEKAQGLPATFEDISQRWSQDYAPAPADAANVDAMSWVRSGAALADTIVYVGIEADHAPTKGYDLTQRTLCMRQAVLGGARLAAILNDTLGK